VTSAFRKAGIAAAALVAAAAMSLTLSAQQKGTHYIRYTRGNTTSFGILEGETVRELRGDLFQNPKPTGKTYKLKDVKLELPLDPTKISKIIGIGANGGPPAPKPLPVHPHPWLFLKWPGGLVGEGSAIERYPESKALMWEGELVLVIGKKGRHIPLAEAPSYIFGVAVGQDVTELDWFLQKGGRNTPGIVEGKAGDTYTGIGREIVTGVDYNNLRVVTKKNGTVVMDGNTSRFVNSSAALVHYLSRYFTLMPGDLIYTGCLCPRPDLTAKSEMLDPGDSIDVEIENVGTLHQTVVAVKEPPIVLTGKEGR
jgi:2-keto-4-pentenoate hydratase/2-oxohepta-3-ene-1,7-dioic acid hydratase in catechol pathway